MDRRGVCRSLAFVGALAAALTAAAGAQDLWREGEKHLRNIRQLTFGGENAEAYWSRDGKKLILQSTRDSLHCDQIFTMDADGSNVRLVSTGKGRTTCAFFFPDGKRILYASTHLASPDCPPPPDYSKGYVWKLYPSYDLFSADPDGSHLVRLTATEGYDAEGTIGPDGRILFTSGRDGDLDLYSMNADGSDVRRLTKEPGYDGGGFFSADGKKIVWRASRPRTPEEKTAYEDLRQNHVIRPGALEIFIANADGSEPKQLTSNGAANFCPFFTPDGTKVIFASNVGAPQSRNFDLWLIRVDGTGLEQVTFDPTFDGFPMFSPDGKRLVFASNRNSKGRTDTNIFLADWVE